MNTLSESPAARVAAVIVAAGRGERAGGPLPKQYASVAGRPVLARSVEAMAQAAAAVQLVIGAADAALCGGALSGLAPAVAQRLRPPVTGGATRQASVLAGLEALEGLAPDIVLVHDAARPFASTALVERVIEGARRCGAVIPGVPVVDTVKQVDAQARIAGTPDRATLRAVQTPQGFSYAALLAAHRRARDAGVTTLTDDAAVMEWAGHAVEVVEGDPTNVKLTTPADFRRAETDHGTAMETRVGSGFDVHAFTEGTFVTLGGIRIPHDRALLGHSDADVVLHAVTDAVLGAIADGDIGQHFPPSDPQWKGAASDRFLAFAVERLRARGGRLVLLDVTVVCETPRIGPHRDAMRERIAGICGIGPDRVAIKATTSEQLGFTGRREGIVAQALATVEVPRETAGG
jgi:2-C-methyl-D-erythritol 4-phosphate cytidylyltransferase / 2-C-methyl-D-erythritol 2,4-cyclodiphosphate synthase